MDRGYKMGVDKTCSQILPLREFSLNHHFRPKKSLTESVAGSVLLATASRFREFHRRDFFPGQHFVSGGCRLAYECCGRSRDVINGRRYEQGGDLIFPF